VRIVVLDTETTGLAVEKGHRVVEIGCVELLERRPSGRVFQRYLNPQRPMDAGAMEVTGLSDEFLSDKALFADVADEFLDFIRGAELVIHNAAFDVGFLDAELARLGRGIPPLRQLAIVTDSLLLARERFPGQRNSLDALCRRFEIDNAHRTQHGALLDAELLAEVYLSLTAGQGDLVLETRAPTPARIAADGLRPVPTGVRLRVRHADPEELRLHEQRIEALGERAVRGWGLEPAPREPACA
jgi:DNA polymerase III subunit epsilon